MTKTRPLGTQTMPPNQVVWYYVRKDGVKTQSAHNVRPAYNRRVGRKSTINSSTGKDSRFRPCVHDQESYSVIPLTTLNGEPDYQTVGPVSSTTVVEGRISGVLQDVHRQYYDYFKSSCDTATASLASVQWAALGETAIQGMTPSFTGENSLLNFILELKDFKDVFKYLATGFRKKLDRINVFVIRDKTGKRRAVNTYPKGKPLEWISRRYLEYSFGWLPFYNDVVALYESIRDFEASFREMVRRELKPQQRYWGTTIPGTATSASVAYSNTSAGPQGGWFGVANNRFRVRVDKEACAGVRYSATMRYRYKLPAELFAVGGKLKAYLDLLGVNRNPAVLWNAIPFSFIVDWFVDVSKFLERLKLDNVQIQTEILDFCHSARVEQVVRYSIGGEKIIESISPAQKLRYAQAERVTDTCKKVSYKRLVGIPNFRAAILWNGLSPSKFALAGALMGAKKGY